MRRLTAACDTWELAKPFAISSGVIDCLTVLVVQVEADGFVGRGEGVPSGARMVSRADGQRIAERARVAISDMRAAVEGGLEPEELLTVMTAGPARNALDCALWDLRAKQTGRPVPRIVGVELPESLVTAHTIPLWDLEQVRADAHRHREWPLFKIKLGGSHDLESVAAVRKLAPDAKIIVDVNGGWSVDRLAKTAPGLARLGVELIEQPLSPEADHELAGFESPVPLCADESCQVRADLERIGERYDCVNVKLDKTGGLTEALAVAREARRRDLGVMVGCMAGTSLSMAAASIVAALCDYVDLDGPLLLRHDRPDGFRYQNGRYRPLNPQLWG